MGYSYYDSPEGEDCFLKLWYTGKIATFAGLAAATYDVLFYSHPRGYYQTVARYGHVTLPFVGMAAAFTSTVCLTTSIRKKDDYLNYFLGGAAAGSIFGIWKKSAFHGIRLAVILGIAAVVKKSSIEEGWEFFPSRPRGEGWLYYVDHNHTVMRDTTRKDLMWSVKEGED